jgi:hypothetical protein
MNLKSTIFTFPDWAISIDSSLLPAFTLSFFTAGDICYLTLPTCLPFPVGPSDVRPVMVPDEFATFQAIIVIAPELDLHFRKPRFARVFPFPFPSMLLAIKAAVYRQTNN